MTHVKRGPQLDRRQVLQLSVGGAAALWLGLGSNAFAQAGSIKAAWYGGQDLHDRMQKALALFTEKNPDIAVTSEFAPFAEFYDRLPVQYAGGGAPDMHRHSMTYLFSYMDRGLLADLTPHVGSTIDISGLYPGVVEIGTQDERVQAIGNNQIALGLFYNQAKLDAAGVSAEDMANLTWDSYRDIAIKVAEAGGANSYGTNDGGGFLGFFELFVTQRGKSLYADGGLGFEKQDLIDWFNYWHDMRANRGAPPPAITAESAGFQNAPMVKNTAAMQTGWCQQLVFYQALMTDELAVTTCPSLADASDNGHLIRALDFWVVPARSSNLEPAAKLINFLLNDEEAIAILGLALGGPASDKASAVLAETADVPGGKVLKYLEDLRSKASPEAPGWASGHGEIESTLNRLNGAIGFEQITPEAATDELFAEAERIFG